MDILKRPILGFTLAAAALAAPAWGQEDDELVRKDLQSVIALQGQPCGEVTRFEQQGPNDYAVTCSNGNRYRVFVDAEEQVVVEPR
jgi:hypothetical protein